MVRLTAEYMIDNSSWGSEWSSLRHFCRNVMEDGYSRVYGGRAAERCINCKKETPKKILFIYNLWKWHNG